MISFLRAKPSQVEQGANWAVVCSIPPSEVGTGITACVGNESDESGELGRESGRKYMYLRLWELACLFWLRLKLYLEERSTRDISSI